MWIQSTHSILTRTFLLGRLNRRRHLTPPAKMVPPGCDYREWETVSTPLCADWVYQDLTCKRGSVGQSEGLSIPRSSVRFRLKPDNSNSHEIELHRPSNKGTKLLLKVIKAIIIINKGFYPSSSWQTKSSPQTLTSWSPSSWALSNSRYRPSK